METVSTQTFKEGLKLLTGAVTIIATDGHHGKGGFTATAVCSVTDNPPTLLFCIKKENDLADILMANGLFSVNMLRQGQDALANRFAGYDEVPMETRLEVGEWQYDDNGLPLLSTALASIICQVTETTSSGTHWVVFGKLLEVRLFEAGLPLLYFDRAYRTLQ